MFAVMPWVNQRLAHAINVVRKATLPGSVRIQPRVKLRLVHATDVEKKVTLPGNVRI